MSAPSFDPDRSLFRHRPFLFYFGARSFSSFARQVAAVAVGWQVYALTHSAFALGMVGLVQFLPTLLLVFVAGHLVDRCDRRRILQICQAIESLTAAFLAWGSFAGWLSVHEIFAAVVVFGAATAFESPAVSALLAGVSPQGKLQKAAAISTAAFQVATISGPALGGLVYAVSPGMPYAVMAVFWLCASLLNAANRLERSAPAKEPPTLAGMFAGAKFVRHHPAILGTISLDLVAVLLGGATALLPIYAHDILRTGPWGLGVLRGAPAIGALLTSIVLARYSMKKRVGMRMFQAVITFGAATVVFALSSQLWLSLLALAVMGAADMVSVVIRLSLVQLSTPDHMRGRVGAVNYLFVNASNQLGEFESGMTAALFGAVPAAVLGGVGTIVTALLWMKWFPDLRKMERLE
jgi:MFS family permease